MPHDHPHHDNHLDPMDARVRALETILTRKGLVDPAAIDVIVETYAHKVGPRNGAAVVARAWTDPAFADWLALWILPGEPDISPLAALAPAGLAVALATILEAVTRWGLDNLTVTAAAAAVLMFWPF